MRKHVVYKLINKTNGKIYIGMSNNIKRRWRNNGIEYVSNKNLPLSNAIRKYGFDNFSEEIIQDNLSYKEACELEIEEIKKQKARDSNIGYNIAKGGNGGFIYKEHPRGMLGKTQSDEFKRKKSLEMTNNNPCYKGFWSEEGREHPRGMLGKTHSEETKSRISKSIKGKNKKKTLVIYPNGEYKEYDSRETAASSIGVMDTSSIFINLLKTGEPYKHHYKKHKHLDGIKIKTID